MASSHTPHFLESLAPHPGSAAHTVAYIVHQLGYWPEDSLVLVLADKTLGPLARVDHKKKRTHKESVSLISHLFQTFSENSLSEGNVPHFLLAIFGPNTPTRRRQLEHHLNQPPHIDEIESDQIASTQCAYWEQAGLESASTHGKTLLDVLYIGEVSYWSIHPLTQKLTLSGLIDEVQRTDVYLNLLLSGSSVAPCESEAQKYYLPSLEHSCDLETKNWWEGEMVLWLNEYIRYIKASDSTYAKDFLSQKYFENVLWNHALQQVIEVSTQYQHRKTAEFADAIRKTLDPHLIAFLGATLTSELSSQSVIYTVALGLEETTSFYHQLSRAYKNSSDHDILCPLGYEQYLVSAQKLMVQRNESSQTQNTDIIDRSLKKFASVLLGKHRVRPDTQRIAAAEIICALILRVYEQPETAQAYIVLGWGSWATGQCTKAREYVRRAKEQLPYEQVFLKNIEQLPPWLGKGI
ncbi:hypothetical protein ACN083_05640 [Rothia sp. CCM 9418]|uniref:hypothetical protein n=1 Tax=Rothia sp. CCM 9418 TaxID=3402661 RepID=UPI003AE2CEF8